MIILTNYCLFPISCYLMEKQLGKQILMKAIWNLSNGKMNMWKYVKIKMNLLQVWD